MTYSCMPAAGGEVLQCLMEICLSATTLPTRSESDSEMMKGGGLFLDFTGLSIGPNPRGCIKKMCDS